MPVKATIDGDVWEFSTAAEAAEFKRSLTAQAMPSKSDRKSRKRRGQRAPVAESPMNGPHTPSGNGFSKSSKQILEAIRGNTAGLQTEAFAQAIGSSSPRSVPPRMMMLGKELKALGLKPTDVIIRTRVYVKGRARSVFKPGPRLNEVLQ